MTEFALYKKSNKFYWSNNKIIYSAIFFCCGIMLFRQKVLNLEENSFDKFFMWLTIFGFLSGLVSKIICSNKVEPLNGSLVGYLTFEKEFIKVNEEIFLLDKVKKIQISNDDYIGKRVNISKGNFGPALSNGINNFIIIFFESGQTKKYQFELINSDDFQNVRTALIEYYVKKKIDFWELANVLGEKSTEEIAELTKQTEEISNTTKTRF
jgi:hypothetical protein